MLNKIEIGNTDIFLEYFVENRGKITISDFDNGAFTYYWGSMGGDLNWFLTKINAGYFANKLCTKEYVFSSKQSVSNVRRFIREEMKYDLPWYKFMSAQKELREKLNDIDNFSCDEREFVYQMENLSDSLMCYDLNHKEEIEFKGIIESLQCEPWGFIGQDYSREYLWLCELHRKLAKKLKKAKEVTNG